jgi:hypothetical protein
MRQWQWLYPIVEILHILGFVVVVGAGFFFDLRLLGVGRALPVTGLARHLLTWARVAFALIVATGSLMFVAHATEWASNPVFRLKLLLLAAAVLNTVVFHRWPFRTVRAWDQGGLAPPGARVAAVLSLGLWTSVIACGRLLAYF